MKLDAMYRLAEDEAAQLRVQFKAQEDDRQHLIRWGEGMQKQQLLQHSTATLLNTCRSSSSTGLTCACAQHYSTHFCYFCAEGKSGLCWWPCRQVLGLKRQNHHLQQQATALQEELDAIMSLEVEEGQRQEERGVQLHLHQQLLQQGGSRPHSAVLGQVRARPMTAGPAGGGSQKQEGTACWRPLSGLTHAQEGRTAGAGELCMCWRVRGPVRCWLVSELSAGSVA